MADPKQQGVDYSAISDEGLVFEDEGLFARDIDGRLIRMEKADQSDFEEIVTLTIDGREVRIKKAVPLTDSQGNIIQDANGQPTPRFTTIYDAASQEFVREMGDQHPIPTLCHQEHLPPVGVCRVCVVEVTENSRYGRRTQLVPSCLQRVSQGMEVHTIESPSDSEAASRVRAAAGTIVDLLCTDHLPADVATGLYANPAEAGAGNELAIVAQRLGVTTSRFGEFLPKGTARSQDQSGKIIDVDHDQCILCGRCSRGCNWLKGNRIIGRSQKGYASIVSFDLGDGMGESDCVSCGECATSCPTGALEFKPEFIRDQKERVKEDTKAQLGRELSDDAFISAEELKSIDLFSGIPYKFLQFNASAVVRRRLKKGDILCKEGEYGASAFIIRSGKFKISIGSSGGAIRTKKATGLRGLFSGLRTVVQPQKGAATLSDMNSAKLGNDEELFRDADDLILGEMSCMNRYPRSATVTAVEESEVLEIRRNVLYMLQRNEVSRDKLNRVYRERALQGQLEGLAIFESLDDQSRQRAADFLKGKAEIVFVEPKQTIIEEGDPAENFYITKLGFVKISQSYGRGDRVLDYLGPGRYFGEIGLLSRLNLLSHESVGGRATATCSALDHVELIRIRFEDVEHLVEEYPAVGDALRDRAAKLLRKDEEAKSQLPTIGIDDAIEQGLYGANNLLVLDLERCTRCDECTKACADTHQGVTRLVREGMRFDNYLVASACRSCMDPYCLVGCPVDAIHREGKTLQITIEDYCIGCELCAQNCPYGNINMHDISKISAKATGPERRATTCDLCHSLDGKPSCVYACPHDAAFRMTGQEFLDRTKKAT